LVIALFVAFVWRGFYIARHAPNSFCSLVVYGLTFKVGLQVMLNVAVVTNSMPNTGISLPFFSYGGTSLILQIIEVAIILAISRYSSHQKI
jgi:cell division protein FtsW